MCVEILNNNTCACIAMDYNKKYNKKVSYSLRKALKTIFKKLKSDEIKDNHHVCGQHSPTESLEALKNNRNAEIEIESKNEANERINAASSRRSSITTEEHYNYKGAAPVHFVCTPNGTFFWTATSSIREDGNLIKQLSCSTDKKITVAQIPRWSQAL